MKKLLIVLFVITVLFVSSCTSYKKSVYLRNAENDIGYQLFNKDKEYKLKEGDILYIEINSLNEKLNSIFNINPVSSTNYNELYLFLRSYSIQDSGIISLPIIGNVKIAGLSLIDAKAKIQSVVDSYLKDATTIVKLVSFKISVLGEVSKPGLYSVYQNKINILDALGLAGNISEYGNAKKILLIRTNENKTTTYRFDLTDDKIINSELFALQPNDVIYVEPVKAKSLRHNISAFSVALSVALTSLSTIVIISNLIVN